MVRLTIDGKVVEAKKGTSILHAAESVGIKIPTLCYIEDYYQTVLVECVW